MAACIDKKRNIAAISVMAAAKIPTWSAESFARMTVPTPCLLYTSDAADEL